MEDSAAPAAKTGMDLFQALGLVLAREARRDEDHVLVLWPGAAGCALAMTGHAGCLVVDRSQPVAAVAPGIVRRPVLGEEHLAARRAGFRLVLWTGPILTDLRLPFSVRRE